MTFTASATDTCDLTVPATVTEFDCFKLTKKGKRIDKTESCVVQTSGASLQILDSGGVGDHITWTVQATDASGNRAETQCSLVVERPAGRP